MAIAATVSEEREGFWSAPLGYPHACLVVVNAVTTGVILHVLVGYDRRLPFGGFAVALAAGVAALAAACWVWRARPFVQWLTGIPFAVVATTAVGLLASVGAAVPQAAIERLHAPSVYASWPFLTPLGLLLANLVGSTARRVWPLTYKNVVFTLTHAGLAAVLVGGALSGAGMERANLVCYEGTPTAAAARQDGSQATLPFRVTLRRFLLDRFPPTLAVATVDRAGADGVRTAPGSAFVRAGSRERIAGYDVVVGRFLPRAIEVGGRYREIQWSTAAPVAYAVVSRSGRKVAEGWVSSGSIESSPAALNLGPDTALIMPAPRPKAFRSIVEIERNGRRETRTVEVNRPISVAGYTLYQTSYDANMGEASEYSVIEVVRDPGLPVVYAGIYMLLAGSALLLWNGARAPRVEGE